MINRVRTVEDRISVRNVLVSVADKRGLETLIPALVSLQSDTHFYSTGNTYRRLAEILGEGANLTSVSDYTGQPEMQGGLVKTLDFKIYLGLLSEANNRDHAEDLARTGAVAFDLVVVNLYPFEQAIAAPDANCEDARAHIDIGGPSMLRAAAKNFLRVAALCEPQSYAGFIAALTAQGGATTLRQRVELCRAAFAHTAHYDAAISDYFEKLDPTMVAAAYSPGV